MARPILTEATIRLPQTPDELWPHLADTSRFNRAVGLPPVSFSYQRTPGGEVQIGEFRLLGWPLARWIEHPFEWQRPRGFSVARDYLSGPLIRVRAGSELRPTQSGTDVRVFAELTPRRTIFAPLIKYVVAPRMVAQSRAYYRYIGESLLQERPEPYRALTHRGSAQEQQRLRMLSDSLQTAGADPAVLDQVERLIAEGPDEDVAGMRPLELAERWGTAPRSTLEAFLMAATSGMMVMRWELLCPSCRGVKASATELRRLETEGRCSACNLHFAANADEGIEARFYPDQGVRTVSVGTYCVGGPMNTPHRLAQLQVGAGEARSVELSLPAGSYIARSPQAASAAFLRVGSDLVEDAPTIRVTEDGLGPDHVNLSLDSTRLSVRNETPFDATLAIDEAAWSVSAATPARLMTFPAFQSHFSAEALASGVELAVGNVGLLFTDLAGSTELYERAGDAAAFRLVSEHFTLLRTAIEQHNGALIKTIGDAVMAAFPSGPQALDAALNLQRSIRELDTRGLADPKSILKVGVHAGPCFIVTLNDQLDYFGTTVNIAARAQGEAHGGEIVVTERIADEAEAVLREASVNVERFEVRLRGLSAPVRLVRLDCSRTV